MEKKEVTIQGPVRLAGMKIYVVSEVWLKCTSGKGGLACFGAKKPTHTVIVSDSEKKAFTIQGEEVTIEELTKDVAGIEALLESQCNAR
jgi:hypothetical protein